MKNTGTKRGREGQENRKRKKEKRENKKGRKKRKRRAEVYAKTSIKEKEGRGEGDVEDTLLENT